MLNVTKNFALKIEKPLILAVRKSSAVPDGEGKYTIVVNIFEDMCFYIFIIEFKVLNLKNVKSKAPPRKPRAKAQILPPR